MFGFYSQICTAQKWSHFLRLFVTGFQEVSGQRRRGLRKYFLLYEHFYSLHLRTFHCKDHWGRSLAVIPVFVLRNLVMHFLSLILKAFRFFCPKCLSRCYLRCFLFVRQVLLDMIECMDQPSLICMKTGQYILLQWSLGSLLFIPDLSDGILCCLCQATSVLFPFQ